ncbi:MAG: MBL fold metallo-hydrolase [Candidatus Eisenbacteria bacterium]
MISFRSLRSGSSGNLLLLENRTSRRRTRVLIDCGLRSQRECCRILEEEVGLSEPLDGLVVTHAHGDHINYAALRVLSRLRVPIHAHHRTAREISARSLSPYRLPASVDPRDIHLLRFGDEPFEIGSFTFTPLPVPHAPGVTTHAFLISHAHWRILVASDFNNPEAVVPHIYDCDFIYVESNHDLELLRRHFNPASLFHLSNPAAGQLLHHALDHSRRMPRAIMLAHLSADRNHPEIALATVKEALGSHGAHVPLITAPRYGASEPVIVVE